MAAYEIISRLFGAPVVSSPRDEVVWSKVEDVLNQQDVFFKTEPVEECDDLIRRVRAVAEEFAELPGAKAKVSEYLRETLLHLKHLKTEPPVERLAWQDLRRPSDATLEIPGMISPDAMTYYKWLGRQMRGEGEVVELGVWMGRSTAALLEGLACNPLFADRRLHAFDRFECDNWLSAYVDRWQDEFSPRARSLISKLKLGDGYVDIFLALCSAHQELIEPHVQCVYLNGETGSIPALSWSGKPVELLIHDLGNASDTVEEIWKVFSSSFIPGKTIVVFYQYGHLTGHKLRRFCRQKASQLEPIHKPWGALKGFRFKGWG